MNSKGKAAAVRLANDLSLLPLRAVYTSPLDRALETAQAVAGRHALEPLVRPQLGECHFGEWDGQSFEQLRSDGRWLRFNRTRSMAGAPGGELMLEVQARMLRETETIRQSHDSGFIAIVSHADPIRALICHYLGSPIDMLQRFHVSPTSVTAVRFAEDIPEVLFINYTGANPLAL